MTGKETLKSFFSVSGDEGSFVYNKRMWKDPRKLVLSPNTLRLRKLRHRSCFVGWEIPSPSWVHNLTPSTTVKRFTHTSAGGNTGKVNSFVGIDVTNLTGGILNTEVLLEGNNAVCLGLELLLEFSSSLLHSLYTTIITPLKQLTDQLGPTIASLNCPQLTTANNGGTDLLASFKKTYPGVAKAGWGIWEG